MVMRADQYLKSHCIIALDSSDKKGVFSLLSQIKNEIKWVKVGMELFYAHGPTILEEIKNQDFNIFLDLKLHDIPQTVHNAILSLSEFPFDFLTIHLQGGDAMLKMASEAIRAKNHSAKLLGVSVLTSFSEEQWKKTQHSQCSIQESVNTLIAQEGIHYIHGAICSGFEIENIKQKSHLKTVVPGIRWSSVSHDQSRVMTPAGALSKGADYLVIGREITQSENVEKSLLSLKDHFHANFR